MMQQFRKRGRGQVLLARMLLCAAPLAIAAGIVPSAHAQSQIHSFDIESQPLSSALLSFGRQADLSVLAPTALVEGKTAPQVRGQLSAAAALDQLLAGTGLSYTFVQSNAVRIVADERAGLQRGTVEIPVLDDPNDVVVVTGTNIRGVQAGSSPITVYTADDIARSGAVTTEQFVGKLPQNLATVSQYAAGANGAGPNLDGVSSIDLRGLGAGTTLTLLNGRRMALSNAGTSADVSLIPASAIARVEVLTDGASAIYGSDAIGGVVNFILRDDFEGAETRVSYGGVARGGLRQGDASQVFGAQWGEGRGLVSYNFNSTAALETGDRAYAAAAGPGNLTPVSTRHNLFATFTQDLGERARFSADFGRGWRKLKNGYSNLSSAVLASQTFTQYRSELDQIFGTVEVDYEIADDFVATATASYSEVDVDGVASVIRFNLNPPTTNSIDFSSRNTQLDIGAKVDGVLMTLPGGDLRFSIGAGVLEETYRGVNPLTNQQTTGLLGRRSTYGFAEIFAPLIAPEQQTPLVQSLSVSFAARYTDYADASEPALNKDFGDSTDPKIGVLWKPVDALGIRATYGSSFRAPSLTQLDPAGGLHYLFPLDVGGEPSILIGLAGYPTADLGPETADSYTFGVDYSDPSFPGFSLGATYYNIDYTNRIGAAPTGGLSPFDDPALLPDVIYRPPSAAFLQEALLVTPLLFNFSDVDTTDAQAGAAALFARDDVWIYDNRFRNLAVSQQEGLDFSVTQQVSTALGELQLGANVTHILNYSQQGSANASLLDAVDIPGGPPDWRGRAYATLSNGPFGGTLSLNHVDDYTNPLAPAGQRDVDSWQTVDLNLTYDFRQPGSDKGPRISLSVQNLLDEDPPLLRTGDGSNIIYPVGFDPANANPLGRLIVLGLTQTW